LRFALSEDADGHLVVRVMAKRSKDHHRRRQAPHQQVSPFATTCAATSLQLACPPWRVSRDANRGQRSAYQVDSPPLAPTASTLSGLAPALSTSEKLDLSLDDLLRADAGHVHTRQNRLPLVDLIRPGKNDRNPMEVEKPRRSRSEASSASPRGNQGGQPVPAISPEGLQIGQVIAEGPEHGCKPTPPPGDHWTKYGDQSNGTWWYYDGPLGTWVCRGNGKEVLPTEPIG